VAFTPISGMSWNNMVGADGAIPDNSGNLVDFNVVSPGYFRTMETRFIAGRDFNDHDRSTSPKVAIVNQAFARRLFGNAGPIGHTFRYAGDAGQTVPSYQIIGLVANTKLRQLREDFKPIAYFDTDQNEDPVATTTFVIRMSGSPAGLMNRARTALASVNPSIGVEFRPLSAQLKESLLRESLLATLSGGFGFLAASLAALGLYGVIAYMVARRANEIGVRIALGANRAAVIRLVLREAVLLLAAGIVAGAVFAWWAGRGAATLLFGLQPRDISTLAGAILLLAVIGLLAAWFPARRAGTLDPAAALRST
jgi:predicted permease